YYYYGSPYYYRDGRYYYSDGRVYGDGAAVDQDRRDRERRDGERMEGDRRDGTRPDGTRPPTPRPEGTRPGETKPPVPDRSGGDAKLNNAARMILEVPMDSKVFVDGIATKQAFASKRSFLSPPLERGQNYVYDVKVEIVRGGQTLTETQQIKVRAGEETRAVFNKLLTPAAAPVVAWF